MKKKKKKIIATSPCAEILYFRLGKIILCIALTVKRVF